MRRKKIRPHFSGSFYFTGHNNLQLHPFPCKCQDFISLHSCLNCHLSLCDTSFAQSSANGHLGLFHFQVIVGVHVSLWYVTLEPFRDITDTALAESHGSSISSISRMSILVSIAAAPAYIPLPHMLLSITAHS